MTDMITQDTAAEAADDLRGKFLTFYIGDSIYGVELLHVIEIIQVQAITHVPFLPEYIKGIINLRSNVVPVIDTRLKFHIGEKEYDDKTCILIIDLDGMRVGMIVDSVSEVVTLGSDNVSVPPKVDAGHRNEYLKSVAEVGGKIILNLDCEKFFLGDIA